MKMQTISTGMNTTWFVTLRKCPDCKKQRLVSDGQNNYYCNKCGYSEGRIDFDKCKKEKDMAIGEPGWYV